MALLLRYTSEQNFSEKKKAIRHLNCCHKRSIRSYKTILVRCLSALNLVALVPNRRTVSLADWWLKAWRKVPKQHKKGFNSLVMLGAWILWKHRNACVFDGSAPCLQVALQAYRDEFHLWQVAGAKGLRALGVDRVD